MPAGQANNGVAFTVAAGPVIHSLSPTWGPVGTVVTISGANFGATQGSSTVKFNGTTASTSTRTNTTIVVTVPSGATSGLVVVTRSGLPASPGVPFTVGAEEVVYYTTDGIGSVRMVTTFGQHVVSRHDYLPFGEPWQPGPSHPQPLGFAGKELDPETSTSSSQALNYFGARYLHSATGRFTSPDPVVDIRTSIAIPQRWNAYSYVLNNPIRYTDPDGRCVGVLAGADTVACAAGALTAGAVLKAAIATAIVSVAVWLSHRGVMDEDASEDQPEVPKGRGLDDILKDDELFARWLGHKHPNDRPLSHHDAQKVWDKLVGAGRQPRLDQGHSGTKWETPHINVEGTSVHIPVEPGFVPW